MTGKIDRHLYSAEIAALTGIKNPALRRALATVPREDFLPPGPWLIESLTGVYYRSDDADPRHVLHGIAVAIDAQRMLNNANPIQFAGQIELAGLNAGETVFHVGAGLGYYSALMAELVGPSGHVLAAEIDEGLRGRAAANLTSWPQVELVGDALDRALPPLDFIYSSAGLGTLPSPWLAALKPGGRMVLPITGPHDHGIVFLIEKGRDAPESAPLAVRMLAFTRHYPCLGTRDGTTLATLSNALSRPPSEVSSLRVDPHGRGPDCWLHGEGWCLSTRRNS